MALRTENGWYQVGPDACQWVTVPGTNVTLFIQTGWPLAILRAFAADYNDHVEPLRDADSACWTPTNSVATSNHLSGTGMDLNWNGPDGGTFRYGIPKERAYPGDKARKLDELIAFYEGMIFCGGEWSIRDWMHFQLGGNTYNNPKTGDFIARKIRADGYSTFRRGNTAVSPPTVDVLARAMAPTSVGRDRLAALLPAVTQCLRECGCTTVERIAMWCAQIGHESAGLKYMEEIASGAAYEGRVDLGNTQPGDGVRFKGRGPIQVTGRHNYTELSRWAHSKGLVPSPTFFVDQPAQLASDRYGFIGVTWYWTTQRPMNDAADARDIVRATQYVNGGTNGLEDSPDGTPGRRTRYQRALAMGDQLLTLVATPTTDPLEELLMLEVESWSIYADPGEPKIPAVKMIQALDAHGPHEPYVEKQARAGDYDAIRRVARTAGGKGKYGDAPGPRSQALAVLLEIQAAHPEWITAATPGKA